MYVHYKIIVLPAYFSFNVLIQNNNIILYGKSKKFFIYYKSLKKKTSVHINSRGIQITSEYPQIQKKLEFLHHIVQTISRSWEIYFYKKFKFKSKGLKIKRKRRFILKFFFWLSHVNLAIVYNCKLRRIGKQKYVFISSNWIYLKKICINMQNVRPNDLFTKKGMRFGRQIVLKKRGKKVTYI